MTNDFQTSTSESPVDSESSSSHQVKHDSWLNWNFRTKATLLAIAIGVMPVTIIGGVAYSLTKASLIEQINQAQLKGESPERNSGALFAPLQKLSQTIFWGTIFTTIFTTIIVGAIAAYLANRATLPILETTAVLKKLGQGQLDTRLEVTGNNEISRLGDNVNLMAERMQQLLQKQSNALKELENARHQAETLAEEQTQKNQTIQLKLLDLLQDVEGASGGDLTVRAQINDSEIGIVADFFNSIIENLRDIVTQVKQAANQVNNSVGDNRGAIADLTEEAQHQAEQIAQTLNSVEQMAQSIQQIAQKARNAAKVAHIASNKAEDGGASMERTVESILQLQETIGKTADKAKELGDASQKISRVISLINQIAMQTNLLAINASIEAARAGEEGRGFAVVAEEVGGLATQSAEATKEVEKIISTIQKEIAEVVEAMEMGNERVLEGTRLVEDTKNSLEQILGVSRHIDSLVESISQTTVSQAQTSQAVTQLMGQIAQISEKTSSTSQEVSLSLETTVAIARQLQSSVDTFKVEQPN